MTAIQAAILAIDLVLEGVSDIEAFDRVANGIAAKAEKEGRDTTDDEMALIKGLRDESAKRRRGEV